MQDGKPLRLEILERGRLLFISIMKQDEGVWLEGLATVCQSGGAFALRLAADSMTIGPSAHWAVRFSLSGDPDFILERLGPGAMKLGILGWSGTFASP